MNKLLILMLICLIILGLFFAPSTCNGVTYYRGYRGCGNDNSNNNGKNSIFFNLINY